MSAIRVPAELADLVSRCAEIAVQLRDIGETTYADDIETLIRAYVTELSGGPHL